MDAYPVYMPTDKPGLAVFSIVDTVRVGKLVVEGILSFKMVPAGSVLCVDASGSVFGSSNLVLANSGYTGIGETSPNAPLSVNSPSASTPPITVGGNLTLSDFQWVPDGDERSILVTGAYGTVRSYGNIVLGRNQSEAADQVLGNVHFVQRVSGKSNPDGYCGIKAVLSCTSEGSGGGTNGVVTIGISSGTGKVKICHSSAKLSFFDATPVNRNSTSFALNSGSYSYNLPANPTAQEVGDCLRQLLAYLGSISGLGLVAVTS